MRYKEYNVNKVLEQAIELFWQGGYNGCSINDLVELTGVNRFSLYHEFSNKEGILYRSLELYKERHCNKHLSMLFEEGNSKDILQNFYMSFLKKPAPYQGCYFIHIGTELADSDAKVKEALDQYL